MAFVRWANLTIPEQGTMDQRRVPMIRNKGKEFMG